MHQRQVLDLLRDVKNGNCPSIQFVTPAVSTMVAAYVHSNRNRAGQIHFAGDAQSYAKNIGLDELLSGHCEPPRRGGQHGRTYSPLTQLRSYSEVDACNKVINDLFMMQLSNDDHKLVRFLAQVVGELHDNVASHANGMGFSAAQVYRNGDDQQLVFSIADNGQGMLRNVQRIETALVSDQEAIRWCMQKENTTATADDFYAQRLPEDATYNPYPDGTPVTRSKNHHVGLGLWHLSKIVTHGKSNLSVISGSGSYRMTFSSPEPILEEIPLRWPGVAIEFTITVPRDGSPAIASEGVFDELAESLGL